jgi:signal transduction histidine kinase
VKDHSVAQRVAIGGATVLLVTLALVGAGTGAALHAARRRAFDEALLAAAHGRAHPDPTVEVEVEHSRSPVEAWLVGDRDPRVPEDARRRALRGEGPLFVDAGERRLVLLPFEVERGEEEDDARGLAAAAAPRLTLARSVGPFAASYGLIATAAAVVATLALVQVVRAAFRPLDRARDEVARVVRPGEDTRLTVAGPVELRALLEAMNDLLQRLSSAHQAQARFTAEAAHELRTPVTSMLGELEVVLRGASTMEECRAALTSTREEVERLRRIVEGLTTLARLDAGQVERGREPVRAAEVAASALSTEAKTLELAGNRARLVVDDDPELLASRTLLEVALANLLRNCARHAPGADVVLRVRREGEQAVFEVDDAGPGAPPDVREALFDRFARGGEARRRDRSGLGLGLPIAREVARRHGGDCVLDAAPGGGLRARLSVPCGRPDQL